MFLLPAIICATAVHSAADSTKPRDGWIAADFQGLDDYPGNQLEKKISNFFIYMSFNRNSQGKI